jgi:hypothetical protein
MGPMRSPRAKSLPISTPNPVLVAADSLNEENGYHGKQTGIPVHLALVAPGRTLTDLSPDGRVALCDLPVRTTTVADHNAPDMCPACLKLWKPNLAVVFGPFKSNCGALA